MYRLRERALLLMVYPSRLSRASLPTPSCPSTPRQICELNRQFRDVAMLAEQGYLYLEGVHGLVHPKVRRLSNLHLAPI